MQMRWFQKVFFIFCLVCFYFVSTHVCVVVLMCFIEKIDMMRVEPKMISFVVPTSNVARTIEL